MFMNTGKNRSIKINFETIACYVCGYRGLLEVSLLRIIIRSIVVGVWTFVVTMKQSILYN